MRRRAFLFVAVFSLLLPGSLAAAPESPAVPPGHEIQGRDLVFDLKTGLVAFTLDQPARVQVRIGMAGDLLLRTLLDYAPFPPGRYEFQWDGKDESGVMDLMGVPGLKAMFSAYALPEGSVARVPHGWKQSEPGFRPVGARRAAPVARNPHADHPREKCGAPRFRVEFPGVEKTVAGLPVVKGRLPLRLVIDDPDRARMIGERFEWIVFIDRTFLYEDEEAITPATYRLDISDISPGEHVVTVVLEGANDHTSVRSARVFIEKETD